jgi:hypothetical protein
MPRARYTQENDPKRRDAKGALRIESRITMINASKANG